MGEARFSQVRFAIPRQLRWTRFSRLAYHISDLQSPLPSLLELIVLYSMIRLLNLRH